MKPEHYPDLQRCEELTKIGFPETDKVQIQKELMKDEFRICDRWDYSQYEDEMYAKLVCPSIAEMLDVIPSEIIDTRWKIQRLEIYNNSEYWYVCYCALHDQIQHVSGKISDDTLPNALCDLIIWLISQWYRFEDGKLIK